MKSTKKQRQCAHDWEYQVCSLCQLHWRDLPKSDPMRQFFENQMVLRPLIVFDGDEWFVRKVETAIHDERAGEMVYRCAVHLGGPFATIEEAVQCAKNSLDGSEQAD